MRFLSVGSLALLVVACGSEASTEATADPLPPVQAAHALPGPSASPEDVYRAVLEAWARGDVDGYFAGYRDPIECYEDRPDTVANLRRLFAPALERSAEQTPAEQPVLTVLRRADDEVVIERRTTLITRLGELRSMWSAARLVQGPDGWRIVAEGRAGDACFAALLGDRAGEPVALDRAELVAGWLAAAHTHDGVRADSRALVRLRGEDRALLWISPGAEPRSECRSRLGERAARDTSGWTCDAELTRCTHANRTFLLREIGGVRRLVAVVEHSGTPPATEAPEIDQLVARRDELCPIGARAVDAPRSIVERCGLPPGQLAWIAVGPAGEGPAARFSESLTTSAQRECLEAAAREAAIPAGGHVTLVVRRDGMTTSTNTPIYFIEDVGVADAHPRLIASACIIREDAACVLAALESTELQPLERTMIAWAHAYLGHREPLRAFLSSSDGLGALAERARAPYVQALSALDGGESWHEPYPSPFGH